MPSLRHCSGGPPPLAIHGRGRLPRHPCRGAPCATPAFGLWERGRQIKIKSQSQARRPDSRPDVCQVHRRWTPMSCPPKIQLCASLLAKADLHSTLMSTDRASSRAGSLPQGKCVRFEETGRPVGRLAFDFDTPPPREAHGAGPERGHAEPRRGTERQGQEPLVTWGFSK
ncbi:hypothetical protein ABH912_000260 [Pseudomonas sp. BT76 TE3572]